jgi:hypothetical protein
MMYPLCFTSLKCQRAVIWCNGLHNFKRKKAALLVHAEDFSFLPEL